MNELQKTIKYIKIGSTVVGIVLFTLIIFPLD